MSAGVYQRAGSRDQITACGVSVPFVILSLQVGGVVSIGTVCLKIWIGAQNGLVPVLFPLQGGTIADSRTDGQAFLQRDSLPVTCRAGLKCRRNGQVALGKEG